MSYVIVPTGDIGQFVEADTLEEALDEARIQGTRYHADIQVLKCVRTICPRVTFLEVIE